jgi:Rod binding domain-containing protein
MSDPVTVSGALPIVNQALEPKWVRDGSPSTQKAYESALAFEDTLVEQLSQSLTSTSGLTGESSTGGESSGEQGSEEGAGSTSGAGNSELSSLLPQGLTASVMHAGGLGLAAQMTRELEGVGASERAHASGGVGGGGANGARQTAAPSSAGAAGGDSPGAGAS